MNMRGYALNEAVSRDSFGLVAWVRRVARNWQCHRDLKKLLVMDDHMLRDVGLTRELILHLSALPLSVDVDWERERVLRVR
jgi:uncharacterized protein YjiS (DUF1127 family)